MMDETDNRGIVAESERTQKYKCRLYCNLSCWQIYRYDVYHPLTTFLLFSSPLAAKSPGSPLLLFSQWANTKVVLADL